MGPSQIRKALGAVKDQTSIGLAKVSSSNSLSDLDVAIVKATRHEEYPAEERYIKEILNLTCYSRAYVSSCINTLSKRLNKTKNWTVAIKTLMLIHRLLSEGDPAYEQEIFFATRCGTRLLNMSDFRDRSRSKSWDYSAFIRTYAQYLDDQLEFRMHGRHGLVGVVGSDEEEEAGTTSYMRTTPVREMKIERIFTRIKQLQQLLDRFIACRPSGAAKNNRMVIVSLYPIVNESFHIYYDIIEILGILIERFMELEVPECVKVYDIFTRIENQFDELDIFYNWCKALGVSKSSDYPEIKRITPKKLEVMDEFIQEKSAMAQIKRANKNQAPKIKVVQEEKKQEVVIKEEKNTMKALFHEEEKEEIKQEEREKEEENNPQQEMDLLNLGDEQGDKLALDLFDGGSTTMTTTTVRVAEPAWEAFSLEDSAEWETALVQSTSNLKNQKVAPGGGFDMLLLDGMYQNSTSGATASGGREATGSASSVAFGSSGQTAMLALPAPPVPGSGTTMVGMDPFAASLSVAPPAYVQMSEIEKKQKLLVEEQLMWQQYARDGMTNTHRY